ncbi:unnamed protein product [Rotaria sordida]|uniref:Magnesium transport protein CorA n=1 Tax=Rotaria sordida TaxID=392033 RepID=A0A814YE74_9BILA|nr:unnamed protein product [Rotaria sordida]
MAKNAAEYRKRFMPFKRTKPGIGAEHYVAHGRRPTIRGRLTQFGFGACLSHKLLHISDPTLPVQLNVFTYDENSYTEGKYKNVADIPTVPFAPMTPMTWIDVDGIHDHEIISAIGDRYDIHSLVQTDITTSEQRTKLDVLDDALFLVCKLIYRDIDRTGQIITEQISCYLKDNLLITFQETPKDLFDSIKNRIRQGKGRIRKSKVDYLFYSLLDVIVDHYMDVLDTLGTTVEEIDNQLMKKLKRDTLESIYDMKRDMLYLRSIISPLKEIIIKLQKEEETQIMQESTNIYLKDLFDHIVQVNDSIDTYREMLASFIDFYMMLNSNAMNQVVKTLTMISTIFIPLTFISSIYGMNFDNIPELRYKYAYFIVLAAMAALATLMLLCFKRKHWF